MRTNDNLTMAALVLSVFAIVLAIVVGVMVADRSYHIGGLEHRVLELEQTAKINQLTNDHILELFGSLKVIVTELEGRLHPAEVNQ